MIFGQGNEAATAGAREMKNELGSVIDALSGLEWTALLDGEIHSSNSGAA